MRNSSRPFCVFALLLQFLLQLSAQNPAVDCDTVPVVAQATGGFVTCTSVSATLTGLQHPSALEFHWTGPGGFKTLDVHERVVDWYLPGTYTLTVTGKYGCTAQTSAIIADSCKFYPLVPPECPNPYLPPAESCEEVCVRQFLPVYYWFSNADALPGPQPFNFCGTTHNDQWFAFVAGATSGSIMLEAANCYMGDGLQLALYDDCNGALVACEGGMSGGAGLPLILNVTGLTIGKVYYLLVDGYNGDRCDYQFIIDGNICNAPPSVPGNPKLNGISKVCPEAITYYEIDSPPTATAFLWNAPPGSLINGKPSPVVVYNPGGELVYIEFGDEPGFVTVRALNYFQPPSAPLGIAIKMQPVPPTVLPEKKVCFEDVPFVWEEAPYAVLSAPGTYNLSSDPYVSYLGCDSIVKQKIVISPPKVTNIGSKVLCNGDCFTINGNDYCETGGPYAEVLESWDGCDSTVMFTLLALDPVAEITGGGMLTCSTTSITLGSAPGNGVKSWLNDSGQVIGQGNTLHVTQPGMYMLTTTVTASGVDCIKTDTVVIIQDIAAPSAIAGSPVTLTCTSPEQNLSGSAVPSGASLLWNGPNGFTSTLADPAVTIPGVYTLTATGPANGCTGTATVTVSADQNPPPAFAFADTLDCTKSTANLYGLTADIPDALFLWSGPNGFLSTLQNPQAPEAGLYQLTVTNPINGCTAQTQVMVVANLELPGINVKQWPPACGDSLLYLDASSPAPGAQFFWTGPNGFTANTEDVLVTVADWYRVKVTAPNGCSSEIQILAVPAPPIPKVSISPAAPVITCITPVITLTAFADIAGCTFVWSAPPFPQPGNYTVTATTPDGCTGTAQVTVTQDIDAPTLSAEGGVLTCEQPTTLITAYTTTPGTTITWYGPGFPINQNPALVSEPGEYTAVATAPNGCTSSVTVMVVDSCLVGTTEPINGRNIIVYPNPGSGIVYVKSLNGDPLSAVALHRMDGTLVNRETLSQAGDLVRFDWIDLPAGVYLISLLMDGIWVNKPLVLLE